MLRKHSILLGIIISLLLLLVATLYYPGGSQSDKNSIGYDWKNNYLSNLFDARAVNGSENASRLWAIAGMLFLCASFALFFIKFPKKISSKGAAKIIRYCGVSAMIFTFFGGDTLSRHGDQIRKHAGSYKYVLHHSIRIQVEIAFIGNSFRCLPACFLQL